MGDYPQPPPLVSKYIDSVLRENTALLSAAKSYEGAATIKDCVSYLEAAHSSILHLGRLADIQTIRHGIPPPSTDERTDCGLSPRDELLQTICMNLTAFHMLPPKQEAAARKDNVPVVPATTSGAGGKATAVHAEQAGVVPQATVPSVPHIAPTAATAAAVPAVQAPSAATGTVALPLQPSEVAAALGPVAAAPVAAAASAAARLPVEDTALNRSRTRWSVEEVAMFEAAVKQYGLNKPSQIAAFMGTRSAEQVRERIKWWKRKVGIHKKWQGPAGTPSAGEAGSSGGGAGKGAPTGQSEEGVDSEEEGS